jgi:hypothetical protein
VLSAQAAGDAHKPIAFRTGTIHFAPERITEVEAMGLGPPILALYRQLKLLGALDGIDSVVELGSQGVWCPDVRLLTGLFEAFSRPVPPCQELEVYINATGTGHAASRHLHENLGFKYDCVDIDGNFGSLTLDINFDSVPPESRGKYGLTTNHGTTEHVLDQRNAFKMIHDFTRAGGLMLHALPFTVHLEHGFFNYQPNLFDALARYNSYQTLGTWVGPDWSLSSLVPWEPKLLEFLTLNAKTTHLLVILQRKLHDTEFCVPIQGVYEPMLPKAATDRYHLVVDGKYYSVRRAQQITKEFSYANLNEMPAIDIAKYLGKRVVRRLKRSFGH